MEKVYVWRWTHLTIPLQDGCEEGEDDDVMQVDGGSPLKSLTTQQPSRNTYKIREFFVKWVGRSHWKNSWVSEIRVGVVCTVYDFVCMKCNHWKIHYSLECLLGLCRMCSNIAT